MRLTKNISKLKESKFVAFLPDFKKEKTQKVSSLVFSLIALSFFGLFAIEPTLSTIAKLNKELADSKFVHERLLEKISNLSKLQDSYAQIQGDIPIVLAAIPKNPQLPTLMGQVQTIASQNNITLNGLQSFEVEAANSQPAEKDSYSFSFVVDAEGSYDDTLKFLSDLTTMQRVITIDELSISRRGDIDNLEINLKGVAYFKY